LSGTVTFEFTDVVVDELDTYEARHLVETMTVEELLDYALPGAHVEVERQVTE
jgi:molybdopterin/thiamine biosynthesis adenylyltransferase